MQNSEDDALAAAVAAHRAGRLEDAEPLYLQVLARHPAHPAATLNLGYLYLSRREFHRAEPVFAALLAADAAQLQAWNGRINALIGMEAFEVAELAIAARPDLGEAARAAELRLRQHWANLLLSRREFDRAEGQLRRVCAMDPQDPDAQNDLARLFLAAGRPAEAHAALAAALALAPEHVPSLINQGSAFNAQGRVAEAEASYRRALAADPANVYAVRNLGILLRRQGREDEARALDEAARALGADVGGAHLARGVVLAEAGQPEAAIAAFKLALDQGADRQDVLRRTGGAYATLGRYAEALAALDEAVAMDADDAHALYRRGVLRLRLGDFAAGWADYEARWRAEGVLDGASSAPPHVRARLITHPNRAQLQGRAVTVIGEQGVGDQLMFASVLPELARDAASVDCMCDDRLVRLLSGSMPQIRVRGAGRVGATDAVVAIGSLAHAYRTRRGDFPGTPYLRPRAEVAAAWAARLGPRRGRLRVGISWRGGTPRTRLHERSIPLERLSPILELPDCEFVSLQYGEVRADVEAANLGRARPIRLFPADQIDDFEDLAGLVANLDLVVSVQTALVHLCGAIGAPALVMIPHIAEWRYGAEGEAMPWYGSIRLVRAQARRAWEPVIAQVADAVRAWPDPV